MQALRSFWAKSLLNKIVLVAVVPLLCCCGVVAVQRPNSVAVTSAVTATALPASAPTVAPSSTVAPSTTPESPTATLAPTIALEPEAALDAVVRNALGASNRDVARVDSVLYDGAYIEIVWAINDNLTEDMIKGGAKLDIKTMLQAIASSGIPFTEILVRGTFPLKDAFGATEEKQVVSARYTAETVSRIDFSGFSQNNVYIISDNAILHPAFQE